MFIINYLLVRRTPWEQAGSLFISMLGLGNNKIKNALRRGAIIIDVRTANEFDQGKLQDSINIPIDRIDINLERIRKMPKPIILCSGSSTETDQAITLLKENGIKEIYNGGGWTRLLKLIKSL